MLAYILNSVEWNAISQQTRTHTPTASTNLLSIYVYKQNIYERDICVHIVYELVGAHRACICKRERSESSSIIHENHQSFATIAHMLLCILIHTITFVVQQIDNVLYIFTYIHEYRLHKNIRVYAATRWRFECKEQHKRKLMSIVKK